MRWVTAVLLASMVAVALPTESKTATVEPEAAACDEPCGYIIPIIDLDFPDKLLCGGGRLIYAEEPPTDCYALPALGETRVLEGSFRMYWDAQEEPTYPSDPNNPIVVTFSGTQNNPKWLEMSIEPAEIEISMLDLYDPNRYDIDPERTPIMYYEYEADLTVTLTRTGDPSQKDLDRMEARQGVLAVFLKARSTESGAYYKEAFGVEEFRFQGCMEPTVAAQICPSVAVPQSEEVPGLAPIATIVALAVLAARRRY